MAYYSDELIEEVRSRNDIVDVISGYVRLTKKGSTYFGLCPFHNEKTGSFSVSPNKQMYYCFGCGAGGNVFTFLMQYENFSFPEAMEALAERAGIELPKQEMSAQAKKEADKRQILLEINKAAGKYYYMLLRSEHGKQAYEYFKKRELSDATMQKFGLGYSDKYSDDLYRYLRKLGYDDAILKESGLVSIDEVRGGHDKFWNRAMFPIMDVHNKVIGFGGRVMGDGEPKYLNSPETKVFDKSRNLYALNFARQTKKPQMLLCEGYMDVIALHQAGFDNAVASLGTAFTSGHASLLKRYTKEVYLTFDSDGAGIKAALRAIPILKEVGLTAKVINMKPYKDPDEFIKALGAEEYQKRIDAAENSFMFEIRILEQKYDMKDPEGKTAFQTEVAKKLLDFTTELERNNYMEAVADKYHMSFEALRNLVNQLGTQGGLVKERTPLKSGLNEKKHKKEDGMKQSQKLLLTWLIEYDNLYDKIKDIITPEDFTEDIFRKVAELLYEQKKSGTVNPAQIISLFAEEEEQREVAELFHARIHEVDSAAERDKALKETILRVKDNSISYRSAHLEPTDMQGLQQIVADKRTLQNMEKMHISID
ncbi:DNA primase [Thermoguttaceae bacterium LCP21S3_D4]|uniref:DNA primase n=1 Tax=Roseburia sp. AF20-18LB TaxID=2293129 RepID=UPI000E49B385|nr:DNA primase [Roseburia sp. AF20-18LB]MCI6783518.1 DNA primase [Lachnospiraceae bacterium]MDD6303563.1 DNA primase [Lachnospiraceae bacterium]RGG49194.1 DNA primase [Roseburia sp. AF20-18LB]HCJ75114.1 DNA primase [Roseburia sp.]